MKADNFLSRCHKIIAVAVMVWLSYTVVQWGRDRAKELYSMVQYEFRILTAVNQQCGVHNRHGTTSTCHFLSSICNDFILVALFKIKSFIHPFKLHVSSSHSNLRTFV